MSFYKKSWSGIPQRAYVTLLGLVLLLAPLASCSLPGSSGGTGTAEISNPLQPTPLNLNIPANALKSPVIGQLKDDTKLHVRVTFKLNENSMQAAQQQKVQPDQPSNLDSFAKKVGLDDGVYQKIRSFFNLRGITLNLSKLRTHLAIEAKASTLAKVLKTQFVVHQYNDRTFFAPDAKNPPMVPQVMANAIDVVNGLDDYSAAPSHQLSMSFKSPVSSQTQRQAIDCNPQDQTLFPKDVAHAYGFDKLWNQGLHGENMTVNLVEVDGSYAEDINNYLSCLQGYNGSLKFVNVDGKPQDALGESTLDIEMIAGLVRSSNIVVYQTDASSADQDIWTNVNDELQQILNDNVNNTNKGNVVSVSLGAAENEISSSDVRAIDSSIRQLVQVEHMMVFVASGDCGAFSSRVYNNLAVSYPASDPWAVAVGGTILQIDQNQNRANEVTWSDSSVRSSCKNRWGSGGGNSTAFKQTNWQNAPGVKNQYSRGARQVPDIAAVAYGLAVYYNRQWGSVGGTSAAAPIWAAGLALIHQGLLKERRSFDVSPALFYNVATSSRGLHPYNDITQGNNLYYPATSGWDFATGLGTPNLADFYQAVRNTKR